MDWVTISLSLVDQILKKTPDYDERKRKEYYKLKKDYYNEKSSKDRDDNNVSVYRDELRLFTEVFIKEISG